MVNEEAPPEVGDTVEFLSETGALVARGVARITQDDGAISVDNYGVIGFVNQWPTNVHGTPMTVIRRASQMPPFRHGLYRHYKGGVYRTVALAQHHETRTWQVIYVSLARGALTCARW